MGLKVTGDQSLPVRTLVRTGLFSSCHFFCLCESFRMPSGPVLYALIGLLAGLASGCFGIGGGAIIVPALTLLCGVPYHVAVGTSLALIIPISLAGSLTSWKLNTVDWRITAACALTGMLGAILGTLLVQKIPEMVARRAFAAFLLYAAWRLWNK